MTELEELQEQLSDIITARANIQKRLNALEIKRLEYENIHLNISEIIERMKEIK